MDQPETGAAVAQAPLYPDVPNPDLLDRIPVTARLVVDVGCGTGALGAHYKRINPRARVFGIDADPAAARIAATRLDRVALVDVEHTPLPFDLAGQVDCLIYGDVLEHMKDPWRVLATQRSWLAPGGVVLACVPNVEHWSLVLRLLQDRFDYERDGLLDRQHLRWFSRRTMQQALTEAGLPPIDVASRVFDAEQGRAFVARITPTLRALKVDPQAYAGRALALQYVWRARREPVRTLHVLSTMLDPVGGVSQVRVVDPMRCLAADPTVRTQLWDGRVVPTLDPATPKILIFHRPALTGEAGLLMLRSVVSPDTVVVTEFDDHPDYIPVLQNREVFNFRGVHAVQTTTPQLAAVLRTQNPEVAVFPNGVRALPDVRNHARPGLTLFFGGLNREADWQPHIGVLNAAAAAAGERLRFTIVHDRALFDSLETPHKSFTPTCDYPAYMQLLSDSEISFMPLAENPFNRSKSDLKFIEAASCRVTALASPVVYAESITDGRTGVLFHDAEELRGKLLQMVANPSAVRAIGDAARAWVIEHRMLAYQMQDRVAWYWSLWERRRELHRALLSRVPELAA